MGCAFGSSQTRLGSNRLNCEKLCSSQDFSRGPCLFLEEYDESIKCGNGHNRRAPLSCPTAMLCNIKFAKQSMKCHSYFQNYILYYIVISRNFFKGFSVTCLDSVYQTSQKSVLEEKVSNWTKGPYWDETSFSVIASNLMVTAQNCLSSIGQPLILAFYDTNDTRKKTKHTRKKTNKPRMLMAMVDRDNHQPWDPLGLSHRQQHISLWVGNLRTCLSVCRLHVRWL